MAISINGTTGISGVDGSASTPALQGNDSNTGISFGTDEVAINTNGTQRALIDSSGNINIDSGTLYVDAVNNLVGVGTSSISSGLSVAKYGSQLIPGANVYNIPAGRYHAHLGTAATGQNLWVGFHGEYNAATGSVNLLLQPTFTDVSQQAGAYIGGEATSAGNTAITFGHLTGGATTSSNATKVERARITSGGTFYVGGTTADPIGSSASGALAVGPNANSNALNYYNADNASIKVGRGNNGSIVEFYRNQPSATLVGNITVTTTATAYNTSSDYRLKENVVPVADGVTRLQQLKPSRFNFKAEPTKTVDGFIAHEVQAVVPEAITGEKDAVDDDGNPVYQGIDQSKLVPLLTAALQEAITRIEALEAEVQALKGGN